MTTVNTTVGSWVSTLMPVHPGWGFNQYKNLGTVRKRNTTGTNRTAGTYPGKLKTKVSYRTKPFVQKEVVRPRTIKFTTVKRKVLVRPSVRKFRRVAVPDPRFARIMGSSSPSGSAPLIWKQEPYMTKPVYKVVKVRKRIVLPRITREVVVRPAEQKTRTVWKRDPNFTFEQDHPYSGTFDLRSASAGCSTFRSGAYDNWGASDTLDRTSVTDPWDSNDGIALLGKLREQIAGSSFNAGVALGESPRALKMIAESTTKIYKAYKAVRSGNPIVAAQLLTGKKIPKSKARKLVPTKNAAASNWLELQYGWKPLLTDIYDGAVFIDHQMRNPTRMIFRTTRYAQGSKRIKSVCKWPQNIARLPVYITSSSTIVARLIEKDVVRLAGLMDPASVAWELVPYSFVIDWFVPIGNYLSAKSLSSALTGQFVTTHKFVFKSYGKKAESSYPLASFQDGSKCSISYCSISRTVSTTLSVPKPEIKPLSKIASWGHTLNAVALLVNLKR